MAMHPRNEGAVGQAARRPVGRAAAVALALLVAAGAWAPRAAEAGPLAPVRFLITANDTNLGLFETCRGLGTSTEVLEFRDGGDPSVVRKLPGRLLLTDVICTRSAGSAGSLLPWRELVVTGNVAAARSTVTISEIDTSYTAVRSWTLSQAWPAELQAVGGTSDTVELLRITHEGIERTQ